MQKRNKVRCADLVANLEHRAMLAAIQFEDGRWGVDGVLTRGDGFTGPVDVDYRIRIDTAKVPAYLFKNKKQKNKELAELVDHVEQNFRRVITDVPYQDLTGGLASRSARLSPNPAALTHAVDITEKAYPGWPLSIEASVKWGELSPELQYHYSQYYHFDDAPGG